MRPSLIVAVAGIVWAPFTGRAQEPAAASTPDQSPRTATLADSGAVPWGGERARYGIFGVATGSADPSLPRLWLMEAMRRAEGMDEGIFIPAPVDGRPMPDTGPERDPGGLIRILVDEHLEKNGPGTKEPTKRDSTRPSRLKVPGSTGMGDFLYPPAPEPDKRLDVLGMRMRMRPLPPAEDEGQAALDGVVGRLYRRLHMGDSLDCTSYRAWLWHAPQWHATAWQERWAVAANERPYALIPPVQDGAGRLAFSLPAGRANRGGDGRRTQAALSAGGETHGSWHMQCMVERYKAVLPNAAVPYARVPERSLFAQGLAEPRAGHPRPYRGKRLRCTPAGGWAE